MPLLEITSGAIVAKLNGAVRVIVVSTTKCRQASRKENSVTRYNLEQRIMSAHFYFFFSHIVAHPRLSGSVA